MSIITEFTRNQLFCGKLIEGFILFMPFLWFWLKKVYEVYEIE